MDLFQPHPDFTLVSPVNRIPAEEMDGYLGTYLQAPTHTNKPTPSLIVYQESRTHTSCCVSLWA